MKYKEEKSTQDVSWTPFVWLLALVMFILFVVLWLIPRVMPRNYVLDNPNQPNVIEKVEEVKEDTVIEIPDEIDVDVKVE
jgi:hypothetical protein